MLHKKQPAGAGRPPTGSQNCTPRIVALLAISARLERLSGEANRLFRLADELAQERAELGRRIERLQQSTEGCSHEI